MAAESAKAHKEHLRHEQEHLKWTAEHMRALAILKRVEAHLFQHEAEIATHRAEIHRHEESIAHGSSHAPAPKTGEHEEMAAAHADAGKNHARLMKAIFALDKTL